MKGISKITTKQKTNSKGAQMGSDGKWNTRQPFKSPFQRFSSSSSFKAFIASPLCFKKSACAKKQSAMKRCHA